ncbi:hypothetical protein [Nocardia sp. NPDC047654]|uniref:hypothetical protein n=1 Tax=Nocardia sp. NPDC047654 TaxID=3364314 RepID=UPI00371AEEC5
MVVAEVSYTGRGVTGDSTDRPVDAIARSAELVLLASDAGDSCAAVSVRRAAIAEIISALRAVSQAAATSARNGLLR